MTDPTPSNARAERLTEAIETGPLKAYEIASLLSASRTSVLNWKKRGAITIDNLRGLADITGYRFWWLAFGEGPKQTADDPHPNQHVITSDHLAKISDDHAALVEVLKQSSLAGVLTPAMARNLTELIKGTMPREIKSTHDAESPKANKSPEN